MFSENDILIATVRTLSGTYTQRLTGVKSLKDACSKLGHIIRQARGMITLSISNATSGATSQYRLMSV